MGTLVDATLPEGRHEYTWNGRDASGRAVASGVYWLRLVTPETQHTLKAVLLR